ncbi:hypothetical protein [Nostoc sp.]
MFIDCEQLKIGSIPNVQKRYGWFTDEWLDRRLVMLRSWDDSER